MIWNRVNLNGKFRWLPPGLAKPLILSAFVIGLMTQPALARTETGDLPALCETAAQLASKESGVPLSVLRAISLNETGRKKNGAMVPWPWTVNMEGKGKWFDNQDQARAFVYKYYKTGSRSFDVGCFQINFKWHGKAFTSIEEMFDPLANARYAAKFLKELFDETGDWSAAAGAYHSRTPKFADRYRKRFETFRAGLENLPVIQTAAQTPIERQLTPPQSNKYPLLQGRIGGSTLGSLVPLAPGSRRLIDVSAAQGILNR